jgi:hypothetical protein
MSKRKGQIGLLAFLFTEHDDLCHNDDQATTAGERFDPRRAAGRFAGLHSVAA